MSCSPRTGARRGGSTSAQSLLRTAHVTSDPKRNIAGLRVCRRFHNSLIALFIVQIYRTAEADLCYTVPAKHELHDLATQEQRQRNHKTIAEHDTECIEKALIECDQELPTEESEWLRQYLKMLLDLRGSCSKNRIERQKTDEVNSEEIAKKPRNIVTSVTCGCG